MSSKRIIKSYVIFALLFLAVTVAFWLIGQSIRPPLAVLIALTIMAVGGLLFIRMRAHGQSKQKTRDTEVIQLPPSAKQPGDKKESRRARRKRLHQEPVQDFRPRPLIVEKGEIIPIRDFPPSHDAFPRDVNRPAVSVPLAQFGDEETEGNLNDKLGWFSEPAMSDEQRASADLRKLRREVSKKKSETQSQQPTSGTPSS